MPPRTAYPPPRFGSCLPARHTRRLGSVLASPYGNPPPRFGSCLPVRHTRRLGSVLASPYGIPAASVWCLPPRAAYPPPRFGSCLPVRQPAASVRFLPPRTAHPPPRFVRFRPSLLLPRRPPRQRPPAIRQGFNQVHFRHLFFILQVCNRSC